MIYPIEDIINLGDPLRPYQYQLLISGAPVDINDLSITCQTVSIPGIKASNSIVTNFGIFTRRDPGVLKVLQSLRTTHIEYAQSPFTSAVYEWIKKFGNPHTGSRQIIGDDLVCKMIINTLGDNNSIIETNTWVRVYPISISERSMSNASDSPITVSIDWEGTREACKKL